HRRREAGRVGARPMTEAEWLVCDDPTTMLKHLWGRHLFSTRKTQLFAVAVWRPVPPRSHEDDSAFEIAERYADGLATLDEVLEAFEWGSLEWLHWYGEGGPAFLEDKWEPGRPKQATFLRELFGNPFRPVSLNMSWLTSDVVSLARGIYDERA